MITPATRTLIIRALATVVGTAAAGYGVATDASALMIGALVVFAVRGIWRGLQLPLAGGAVVSLACAIAALAGAIVLTISVDAPRGFALTWFLLLTCFSVSWACEAGLAGSRWSRARPGDDPASRPHQGAGRGERLGSGLVEAVSHALLVVGAAAVAGGVALLVLADPADMVLRVTGLSLALFYGPALAVAGWLLVRRHRRAAQ